jgi:hypothetical protein
MRFRAHVSVLVVVLLASLLAPASAEAATTCSGSRSNYWDLYGTSNPTTMGSTAIIKTRSPTLCTGGTSTFSNAWSLITGRFLVTGPGWAQTGYVRDTLHSSGALSGFSQEVRLYGLTPVTKYFPGPAQDSTHSYQSYTLSTGYLVLYIDANQVDSTTWKPADNWGSQPWSSQFAGETGHCQTDVPGVLTSKAHFTNVTIKQNGNWIAPGTMTSHLDCNGKYAHAIVNSKALDIWIAYA